MEEDDLVSLTVIIELDNDEGPSGRPQLPPKHQFIHPQPKQQQQQQQQHENYYNGTNTGLTLSSKHYFISPPISAKEACRIPSNCGSNIKIRDLSINSQKMLCNRLNSPAIGSMKNWEYLAAILGVSSDDLYNFRRKDDPMSEVLKEIDSLPLEKLIIALGDMERIDVLISLQPYLIGITSNNKKLIKKANDGRKNNGELHHPQNRYISNGFDSALMDTERIGSNSSFKFPSNNKKFAIVTHHEITEKSNQKIFKWFYKNFEDKCEMENIELLNINNCIDETNITQTGQKLFENANQIIVFIVSEDYKNFISNPKNNSRTTTSTNMDSKIFLKQLFHQWMNEEYYSNSCRNKRFRIILNSKSSIDYLPMGWATNTIVYSFPEMFDEFCKRFFEK